MFVAQKKLYIIGFMGSGKSTIGRLLAEEIKMPFIDLDDEIEKEEGRSIYDIFETEGEAYFRLKEQETLVKLLYECPAIISCGGGTPCFYDNITLIKNTGTCIYLRSTSNELAERLYHEKAHRPVIAGINSKAELEKEIQEKLKEREKYYLRAHHNIGTKKTPQEIVEEITFLLNS